MAVSAELGSGACALLLIGASASAQEAPRYYRIAMAVERDGKILGTPTLIAASGVPASVTVDGAYRIEASANVAAGATSSPIAVSSKLYLPDAGRWELAATPSVSIRPGENAEMTINRPKHGSITIKLRVDPVDKAVIDDPA